MFKCLIGCFHLFNFNPNYICNVGSPSEILKLKSRETSPVHNIRYIWPIVLIFCTSTTVSPSCCVENFKTMVTSSNGNIFRVTAFVRGIHRSPVNPPHKDQWRGALMFSLMCVWINGWVNIREAGDLRRHCVHCDVTVMRLCNWVISYGQTRLREIWVQDAFQFRVVISYFTKPLLGSVSTCIKL